MSIRREPWYRTTSVFIHGLVLLVFFGVLQSTLVFGAPDTERFQVERNIRGIVQYRNLDDGEEPDGERFENVDETIIHRFSSAFQGASLSFKAKNLQDVLNDSSVGRFVFERTTKHSIEPGKNDQEGSGDEVDVSSNISAINAHKVDTSQLPLDEVNVAVLDRNIDDGHRMLKGQVTKDVDKNSRSGVYEGGDVSSGTFVAGIIGAESNPSEKRLSVAPGVNLIDVTVLPPQKDGYISDVLAGLEWVDQHAKDEEIHVVNLSIEHTMIKPFDSISFFQSTVESVVEKGIPVVVSAGNKGKNINQFFSSTVPASLEKTITVSALDMDVTPPQRSPSSNFGKLVDVSAPGGGSGVESTVRSTNGENARTGTRSGTSVAAPHVTGVLALVEAELKRQERRSFSSRVARTLLTRQGSRSFSGTPGKQTGPLVDAYQSIDYMRNFKKPADKSSLIGSFKYYKSRHKDFVRRHPDITPPDYYLDYGDKYVRKFSEQKDKLTEQGKETVDRTRSELQILIEEKRKQTPLAFDILEQNSEALRDFAFDTHPDAYEAAGFLDLPMRDRVVFGLTVETDDLFTERSARQIQEIVEREAEQEVVEAGKYLGIDDMEGKVEGVKNAGHQVKKGGHQIRRNVTDPAKRFAKQKMRQGYKAVSNTAHDAKEGAVQAYSMVESWVVGD